MARPPRTCGPGCPWRGVAPGDDRHGECSGAARARREPGSRGAILACVLLLGGLWPGGMEAAPSLTDVEFLCARGEVLAACARHPAHRVQLASAPVPRACRPVRGPARAPACADGSETAWQPQLVIMHPTGDHVVELELHGLDLARIDIDIVICNFESMDGSLAVFGTGGVPLLSPCPRLASTGRQTAPCIQVVAYVDVWYA